MIYTSESLALASLELFVNTGPGEMPDGLVAIPADIPDAVDIEEISVSALPRGWRAYPAPPALSAIGTEWVRAARTAVLSVPSAIVPVERNLLLNPGHAAYRRIRIGTPEPFTFESYRAHPCALRGG